MHVLQTPAVGDDNDIDTKTPRPAGEKDYFLTVGTKSIRSMLDEKNSVMGDLVPRGERNESSKIGIENPFLCGSITVFSCRGISPFARNRLKMDMGIFSLRAERRDRVR